VPTDNLVDYQAVPWVRRLIAGLSPRRSGFDHSPVPMGSVADKVALGQVFPRLYHSISAPHALIYPRRHVAMLSK
jgi:hypothetical protein